MNTEQALKMLKAGKAVRCDLVDAKKSYFKMVGPNIETFHWDNSLNTYGNQLIYCISKATQEGLDVWHEHKELNVLKLKEVKVDSFFKSLTYPDYVRYCHKSGAYLTYEKNGFKETTYSVSDNSPMYLCDCRGDAL